MVKYSTTKKGLKLKLKIMTYVKKYQDKIHYTDPKEDLEKKLELAEKILPLVNGYTLKQIEESFNSVLIDLKNGFIINLED